MKILVVSHPADKVSVNAIQSIYTKNGQVYVMQQPDNLIEVYGRSAPEAAVIHLNILIGVKAENDALKLRINSPRWLMKQMLRLGYRSMLEWRKK